MKVSIYCNFIQPGGVERVSIRLAELLLAHGCETELLSKTGSPIWAASTTVATKNDIRNTVLIFSRKRDLFEMGLKVFTAHHLVYWRHIPYISEKRLGRFLDKTFSMMMSRFGTIVCVCDELRDEVRSIPLVAKERVVTCYSPVQSNTGEKQEIRGFDDPNKLKLAYFGRETAQKCLNEVVSLVVAAKERFPSLSLHIYGYKSRPLDIEDHKDIEFCGTTDDPIGTLQAMSGVILVSKYEGFPTVMVEAAIAGAPIFCNDFRTGLRDFHRLIGPTNKIDSNKSSSLMGAIADLKVGWYKLSNLSNEVVTDQWMRVIDGTKR